MNTSTTTAEFNSLKYVMGKWAEVLTKEAQMNEQLDNDKYYDLQKELNALLVEFIRLHFIYLNTRELLKLCALVSKHRPVAPHSFLIKCSELINE